MGRQCVTWVIKSTRQALQSSREPHGTVGQDYRNHRAHLSAFWGIHDFTIFRSLQYPGRLAIPGMIFFLLCGPCVQLDSCLKSFNLDLFSYNLTYNSPSYQIYTFSLSMLSFVIISKVNVSEKFDHVSSALVSLANVKHTEFPKLFNHSQF